MSGLGGILYFDDREMTERAVRVMDPALARLGPDGARIVVRSSAAFIFRRFDTTREARLECQPLEAEGLVVSFDGRIENRAELVSALSRCSTNTPDVNLIAASYLKWGTNCFSWFRGGFSVAIWDSKKRKLFLARDPFGLRRLFYFSNSQQFIWASVPEAILSVPEVPLVVDEEYVALFLSSYPDGLRSPFRSIHPLTPGTYITVDEGNVQSYRFWDIHAIGPSEQGKRSLESYVEEFRENLFEAVRAQLWADCPVTAELSGGLDSSSIVCVSDELARQSDTPIPRVTTVSYIFDAARASDEREYIANIERHRGETGIYLREDDDPILGTWPDPAFISFPNTDLCFGGLITGKLKALKQLGSRVVLSGLFGDQLFSLADVPCDAARSIRSGRMLHAFALCCKDGLRLRRSAIDLFWTYGIKPNLPTWVRPSSADIPDWIRPEFTRRTGLRTLLDAAAVPGQTGSGASRFDQLLSSLAYLASGYAEMQTTFDCIDVRYPFLYRPLVEFLVSLPTSVIMRPGRGRWLQREALLNILPESIRMRKDKRGPTEAILIAVKREWKGIEDDLIANSRACERGYIARDLLKTEFQRIKHGMTTRSDVLRFVALEMWLRAIEQWPEKTAPYDRFNSETTKVGRHE